MDEHRACTFVEHGFYLMYVKGILSVVIRGRLGCLLSNRPKTPRRLKLCRFCWMWGKLHILESLFQFLTGAGSFLIVTCCSKKVCRPTDTSKLKHQSCCQTPPFMASVSFLICWRSTFPAASAASQTLFREVCCFPSQWLSHRLSVGFRCGLGLNPCVIILSSLRPAMEH